MQLTRTRRTIDSSGARAVAEAALAHARANGYRVVVAVVDAYGELIVLEKLEGTQVISSTVAIDKARSAAIFVRPTRELEAQVSAGRIGALTLHGARALTGGIPLVVDGDVVGAIGTSGETPDEDESVSLAGAGISFSYREVGALTYAGARLAAEGAGAVAASRGVNPVISVVDAGGEAIFLWRPDGAQVASVNVAIDKARTAALYRRPSKDFEDQVAHGRASALALARSVPLQGGLPLYCDGEVVGAIGVSGASSADEDNELATIGVGAFADALAAGEKLQATYVPRELVDAQFATGGLLIDTPGYKIDAGRRTKPGEVEYHDAVTDVMYVTHGSAVVVTGGELIGAYEPSPGERRAPSLAGGLTRQLTVGDVFVIPAGVPHQFVAVSDPFLYYVVKVVG